MMKVFALLICLTLLSTTTSVLILQSSPSTPIVSPAGAQAVTSTYFNGLAGGIAGDGISWITTSKYSSAVTFESLFYASCIGSATLSITAASNFTAYLDGVLIGSGANYTLLYTFPIKISCGNHNFTVVVRAPSTHGLVFAINQDQSNCFNCQNTGFWNENTCSCSCISTLGSQNGCKCTSPKVWKDYPVCGCGCPSIIYHPPITISGILGQASSSSSSSSDGGSGSSADSTSQVATSSFRFCASPKYYSQQTCSCICHIQYCPPKHYFDVDACTCVGIIY